jgi:hypothetical protein
MKAKLGLAALATTLMLAAGGAQAAGCVSGAIVGGVAGHYAGHHAVLGAVGGCLVGHHLAKKQAAQAQVVHVIHHHYTN